MYFAKGKMLDLGSAILIMDFYRVPCAIRLVILSLDSTLHSGKVILRTQVITVDVCNYLFSDFLHKLSVRSVSP